MYNDHLGFVLDLLHHFGDFGLIAQILHLDQVYVIVEMVDHWRGVGDVEVLDLVFSHRRVYQAGEGSQRTSVSYYQ